MCGWEEEGVRVRVSGFVLTNVRADACAQARARMCLSVRTRVDGVGRYCTLVAPLANGMPLPPLVVTHVPTEEQVPI